MNFFVLHRVALNKTAASPCGCQSQVMVHIIIIICLEWYHARKTNAKIMLELAEHFSTCLWFEFVLTKSFHV